MCYARHMEPNLEQRAYSAREVQEVAGLSARQIHDWDSRGALPNSRDGAEGWRRFSSREVFVLAVCAELRRQFSIPVERLRFVQHFMLQDGADHFQAAIRLISTLGVGVWLLTDFESTFVMDSELEFSDMWEHGFFGSDHQKPFVLMAVNPLVNRLLVSLKEPISLEPHGLGYEVMAEVRKAQQVRTPEELLVLQKIRSGEFTKVEVTALDGEVTTIRTTSHPDPQTNLANLLDEPYQRVTLTNKGGSVVSIVKEVTTKVTKHQQ